MNDLTYYVDDLSTAYQEVKRSKKEARATAQREFETQIAQRAAELFGDAEERFADRIREAVEEHGLTHSQIRNLVLHSQDWNLWKRLRELAGLAPERKFWFHDNEEEHY